MCTYDRSQEFVNVSAGDCCSLDGIWWIVHRVHCEFFIFVLVFLGPTKWPKLWKQKWFTFQSLWSCISCENFRIISYKKRCKQWLFVILYFLWKQINTNLQKVTLNGNACFYIDSKFNCLNSNFSCWLLMTRDSGAFLLVISSCVLTSLLKTKITIHPCRCERQE